MGTQIKRLLPGGHKGIHELWEGLNRGPVVGRPKFWKEKTRGWENLPGKYVPGGYIKRKAPSLFLPEFFGAPRVQVCLTFRGKLLLAKTGGEKKATPQKVKFVASCRETPNEELFSPV